jgi:hypothetical protein
MGYWEPLERILFQSSTSHDSVVGEGMFMNVFKESMLAPGVGGGDARVGRPGPSVLWTTFGPVRTQIPVSNTGLAMPKPPAPRRVKNATPLYWPGAREAYQSTQEQ